MTYNFDWGDGVEPTEIRERASALEAELPRETELAPGPRSLYREQGDKLVLDADLRDAYVAHLTRAIDRGRPLI